MFTYLLRTDICKLFIFKIHVRTDIFANYSYSKYVLIFANYSIHIQNTY